MAQAVEKSNQTKVYNHAINPLYVFNCLAVLFYNYNIFFVIKTRNKLYCLNIVYNFVLYMG